MIIDKIASKKFKHIKKMTLGKRIATFVSIGIITIYFSPIIKAQSSNVTYVAANTTAQTLNDTATETEKKKVVALSYDDGPSKTITPQILQLLKDNDCHATFFVLGCNAKRCPGIVLDAYLDGNEIANHGYSHAQFSKLSKEGVNNELNKTAAIICYITNEAPTFVRTPYGENSKKVTSKIDHPIALWSIDSNDWRKNYSVNKVVNNIVSNLKDGSIILLHDTTNKTLQISKILIPKIKAAGYDIVSISDMFKQANIDLENGKVYYKMKR
jgi:peptidoglycan/xylan/chitin deacetylase (PgdA/CDA1 family)